MSGSRRDHFSHFVSRRWHIDDSSGLGRCYLTSAFFDRGPSTMLCHEVPGGRFRPMKKSRRRVGTCPGSILYWIYGWFSSVDIWDLCCKWLTLLNYIYNEQRQNQNSLESSWNGPEKMLRNHHKFRQGDKFGSSDVFFLLTIALIFMQILIKFLFNNAKRILTREFGVPVHRFEIHSALELFAHGFIRLPPREAALWQWNILWAVWAERSFFAFWI